MKDRKLYLKAGFILVFTISLLVFAKLGTDGEQVKTYSSPQFISPTNIEVLPDRVIYSWESTALMGDSLIVKEIKNDTLWKK